MKIGSVVRARHWSKEYIAIVLRFRKTTCTVLMQDGREIMQLISDLEVICEDRQYCKR